eukprot:164339-Rhodomonas_salina.1
MKRLLQGRITLGMLPVRRWRRDFAKSCQPEYVTDHESVRSDAEHPVKSQGRKQQGVRLERFVPSHRVCRSPFCLAQCWNSRLCVVEWLVSVMWMWFSLTTRRGSHMPCSKEVQSTAVLPARDHTFRGLTSQPWSDPYYHCMRIPNAS